MCFHGGVEGDSNGNETTIIYADCLNVNALSVFEVSNHDLLEREGGWGDKNMSV